MGYGCRTHEEGWCIKANAHPHTCTHRPQEAHHIDGVKAGKYNLTRIRSACRNCNLAIGEPTRANDPAPRPVTQW